MTQEQVDLINYQYEVRQREFEKRQLWREVYVAAVRESASHFADKYANIAVQDFKEKFPDPTPPMINKDKSVN